LNGNRGKILVTETSLFFVNEQTSIDSVGRSKFELRFSDVASVEKQNSMFFPKIQILHSNGTRYILEGFRSRDEAFDVIVKVWR
jgi:hypothetical protein